MQQPGWVWRCEALQKVVKPASIDPKLLRKSLLTHFLAGGFKYEVHVSKAGWLKSA